MSARGRWTSPTAGSIWCTKVWTPPSVHSAVGTHHRARVPSLGRHRHDHRAGRLPSPQPASPAQTVRPRRHAATRRERNRHPRRRTHRTSGDQPGERTPPPERTHPYPAIWRGRAPSPRCLRNASRTLGIHRLRASRAALHGGSISASSGRVMAVDTRLPANPSAAATLKQPPAMCAPGMVMFR